MVIRSPLLRAHALEHVGELADLAVQRVVGEAAQIAGLAFPDQGELVAPPRLLMAIERVVDDVGAPADEPLEERLVGVVQRLAPRRMPGQFSGAVLPELHVVGVGLGPERLPVGHVCCGHDFGCGQIDVRVGAGPLVGHGRSFS